MAKTAESVSKELSAMRRCAGIIEELPPHAQRRVASWLFEQQQETITADPRQVDLFAGKPFVVARSDK